MSKNYVGFSKMVFIEKNSIKAYTYYSFVEAEHMLMNYKFTIHFPVLHK